MNANISFFVICGEAIIYLLLCNLHDCTFKARGGRGGADKIDANCGSTATLDLASI